MSLDSRSRLNQAAHIDWCDLSLCRMGVATIHHGACFTMPFLSLRANCGLCFHWAFVARQRAGLLSRKKRWAMLFGTHIGRLLEGSMGRVRAVAAEVIFARCTLCLSDCYVRPQRSSAITRCQHQDPYRGFCASLGFRRELPSLP